MKLAEKKCTACSGDTLPLTQDETLALSEETPDWILLAGRIERTFTFANFSQAIDFANKIAKIADEQNHHPDLHISWGKVRVELSTHAIGGLSVNDFILAAKIDEIAEKDTQAQSI